MDHKNSGQDYRRAKLLRKAASLIERRLWAELSKAMKIFGLKFRRQYPLHPYIVDFACPRARLVIELDGASRDSRLNYDRKREEFLLRQGYEVLRFTNDETMANLEGRRPNDFTKSQSLMRQTSIHTERPLP